MTVYSPSAKNFEVFEFKASNNISVPYSSHQLLQFVPNTKATGTVSIQGTPKEDEWLNLSSNITDPDGTNYYSTNWQIKNGSQWITKKSNDDTLQLTQEFVGKEVRVQVTHTDNQGDQTVFVSSATNAVQNTNDLPTGQLIINGTAKIGETLTLDTSSIQDEDGPTSLSFLILGIDLQMVIIGQLYLMQLVLLIRSWMRCSPRN